MEEKLQNYNKFELNKEIKLLRQRIFYEDNSDQYSDNISSMDDSNDKNFVPSMPQSKTSKSAISLTQRSSENSGSKNTEQKSRSSITLPDELLKKN